MSGAPVRITYQPGNPDTAWAVIAGKTYRAASANGAVFEVARALVGAGLADGPYEAWPVGRAYPGFTGPSLHTIARLECRGGRMRPLKAPPGRPQASPMRPAA